MVLKWLLISVLSSGVLCDNFDIVCHDLVRNYDCSKFPQKPQCGSDGKLYPSECSFAQAHCHSRGLSIVHEGLCTRPTSQPATVASTRGVTMVATDTVTTAKTMVATDTVTTAETVGATDTVAILKTTAGTTMDPIRCQVLIAATCPAGGTQVCASNGLTFNNSCEFEQQKCKTPSISFTKDGPCNTFTIICKAIISSICPSTSQPLCGTDGKTYNNLCEQQKVKCVSNHSLDKAHDGAC